MSIAEIGNNKRRNLEMKTARTLYGQRGRRAREGNWGSDHVETCRP